MSQHDPLQDKESAVKDWPILAPEALYGDIGRAVDLITRDSEADPAAVLLTLLVEISAIIGNLPHFFVADTAHTVRVWVLIVGASSRARKGTSQKPVRRLAHAIEQAIQDTSEPFFVNYTSGPLSSGEGVVYEVRDPSFDSKGELVDSGVLDKRLLIVEGEFGAALRVMQREGNTLSATLRTAWDCAQERDVLRPMTKTNRIAATNPHICVVGHITGAELAALLSSTDQSNGLANRLLWVCARRSKLVPLPDAMASSDFDDLVDSMAPKIRAARQREEISMALATAERWCSIYGTLTADRPGVWGAVTSRAEAQTIRLALLFALIDDSQFIEPAHLDAALAVWRYCDHSARYLFGDAETDPDANKVLEALAAGPKTQTELVNHFNRHLSKAELVGLLGHLQESGRISSEKRKGKGRPATVWRLTDGFALPGAHLIEDSELS